MAMTREKYDKLTSADKEYYDFQAILSPEKRDKDTSADTAAYVNFRNQDKEKKKVAKEEDKPKSFQRAVRTTAAERRMANHHSRYQRSSMP